MGKRVKVRMTHTHYLGDLMRQIEWDPHQDMPDAEDIFVQIARLRIGECGSQSRWQFRRRRMGEVAEEGGGK